MATARGACGLPATNSLTAAARVAATPLAFTFLERGADNAAAFKKVHASLGGGKVGDFGPKNAGIGAFAAEWLAFAAGTERRSVLCLSAVCAAALSVSLVLLFFM